MILGLLSDSHANAAGLRAALDAVEREGAELVICAGDHVGYHLQVNETIDETRSRVAHAVMGNHDAMLVGKLAVSEQERRRYVLAEADAAITEDNREWLESLPSSIELTLGARLVAVFHGSPWAPLTEYVYPDNGAFERFTSVRADIVILGHTHHPLHRRVGDTIIVNPGSCGLPRDTGGGAPYAVLNTTDLSVRFGRATYDEAAVERPYLERNRR